MIGSISIIFPIFNEEKRLSNSLNKIDTFLKKKKFNKIEIIFVDDGSYDKTLSILSLFVKKSKNKKKIKIISLKKNMGKGYALMRGVKFAQNEWVLTADIDLSVRLEQLVIWEKKFLKKNFFVYFGSRSHIDSVIKKSFLRNILGIFFKLFCFFLFRIDISDTQCGFKLYKKNIAKKVFYNLLENGYVHDVEIAYKCLKNNFKITELPIMWEHKSHGKINILIDPIKMFIRLIILRIQLHR